MEKSIRQRILDYMKCYHEQLQDIEAYRQLGDSAAYHQTLAHHPTDEQAESLMHLHEFDMELEQRAQRIATDEKAIMAWLETVKDEDLARLEPQIKLFIDNTDR